MGLINILFGRPLASSEDEGERITPTQGIPTFGLDALSSAAYGPEAALTILLPLGLLGVQYIVPLTFAVIGLLVIVYFSYRQTIAAYPNGGGSYTVAKENLGNRAGLLAGAALMIDYLLNVAVGISAGIGALVSAVPSLLPHTLAMCLAVLIILTVVNLRGVKEAGTAFVAPTYLFVGTLVVVIMLGFYKVVASGGHPVAVVAPPRQASAALQAVGLWILVKTFASGCTALTGVEAVSNGVQAFRKPVVPAARATLTAIIAILILLLGGIAVLVRYYGIMATDPGAPGYQSVLSMVTGGGSGQRDFLPCDNVLSFAGAVSFGEYFVCGFSAAVPDDGARRLSSPFAGDAGTAAGVLAGDLGAGDSIGVAADSVWRSDGPIDSIVCGGGVYGVHLVAGGDGGTLAADGERGGGVAGDAGQWAWGFGYGNHGDGDRGGKVCRGGMGSGVTVAGAVGVYGAYPSSL